MRPPANRPAHARGSRTTNVATPTKRMQSLPRELRHAARGTTQPLFENLEGRRLFSVAVAMAAAGTLTFTGNNAADTVNIEDNGSGVISGNVTNAAGGQTAFGPVG